MPQMKAEVVTLEELQVWPKEVWRQYACEPKRNGARLLYRGDGTFASYTGKPFYNLGTLADTLAGYGSVLDGEVCAGSWEETMSIIRSKKPKDGSKLVFHVFDGMNARHWAEQRSPGTYKQRRTDLREAIGALPNLELVPSRIFKTYPAFLKFYQQCLKSGCDGVVLKRLDGHYEWKRSKLWLKCKPLVDFEATVVGFTPGKGKYADTLGALLLVYTGVLFTSSGMSDAHRRQIWEHQPRYLNKTVEITCRGFHPSGAPIEPRFKRWREEGI